MEVMAPLFTEEFGNAASHTHAYGWRAEAVVELARESIAEQLGADEPRELIFTSGATESNNLAILGTLAAYREKGPHLITVTTEHPSVLDPCAVLERRGVRVTRLPVEPTGLLDPTRLAEVIDDQTCLVSVMAANNEIGVLQPLEEIGALCAERGVLFHSDAAQAAGKVPLDVSRAALDLVSLSGHKVYGPKGVGALYVRRRKAGRRVRIEPILYGGGHERGLRSGTLAVPLIAGMAKALELCALERDAETRRLRALRDRLLELLRKRVPDLKVNGDLERRLPGNLNLAFPGARADALMAALPDLALSSGSACSSARPEPSHVLRALGLSEDRIACSIRIGLGRCNRLADVERAAARIAEEVRSLRAACSPQPSRDPRPGVR